MASSINGSDDDSDDESVHGMSSDEDDENSIPNSQEEEMDDEGVMPAEMEGGLSPIENLQGFNWGDVDDELADFLESGSDNDSDTGSVASDTSRGSSKSLSHRKRKHNETTDDDDSDTGSAVVRKRKKANDRTTGLKTVKTPNSAGSESSLPTPGVTGDEIDEDAVDQIPDGGGDDDIDEDDLEADLLAEFEKEEQEASANTPVENKGEVG